MGDQESLDKANWTRDMLHIFCDICIKATDMGMRPNTHFDRCGWRFILTSFKEQTGHAFTKTQLKNKWDYCKKDWRTWNKLIAETGVGWSYELGTIAASDDWWKQKIQEIRGAKKFRQAGIEPSLKLKFDKMFSGVTATGQYAWAPSSGYVDGNGVDLDTSNVGLDGVDLEEGSGDSEENVNPDCGNDISRGIAGVNMCSSSNTKSSGKRKEREQPEPRARKKRSVGIGAQLVSMQQQLLDSMSSRSDSTSANRDMPGCSIPEVLAEFQSIPGSTSDEDFYINYVYKEPCMVSYNTGMRWLNEILRGHWRRCVNMFRMDKDTLLSLCHDLETNYGLKPSRRMSIIEKVGMFLFTLAVGASNRHVQERFQHSGETVSRCMKEVLKALCMFAVDVIKPADLEFTNTPIEIAGNPRFMPHFKNCIGAIDGTHVRVTVSAENQIPFIGRKGVPTQNIMAACSFDMQFTFVWAGWEGSAHDTRIFLEAIDSRRIKFPKPPAGKYYLVDAGYPNEYGYLGPYKGERYHLQDFRRRGQRSGRQEVFNRAHSSLRNVIECTFGVWKQRWRILHNMPASPYKNQVQILVASMALHNYIRRRSQNDDVFSEFDRNPDYIPDDFLPDIVECGNSQRLQRPSQMDFIRDGIANSLMYE